MSDMTALLNDLSYIPLNNKHNKPTQGDISETSNEPTQARRNKFEELYASANKELYPGCDYVTQLDFMAKFTYFKVKGKLTDSIFNKMLEFFQYVFPISKGYKLPSSYYAIKKTFKMIGLGYESIHACKHDCCLFRGDDNKDLDFYPMCNMSRWKDSNTLGKKVPKKVLRYFLIIPRLQQMSADVSQSHGDDDGGEDPPSTPCTQWQRQTKAQFGGRDAGRLKTCDKTQNLSLKEITNTKGPVPIQFEPCDKQTVMPLSDHAAHWSRYIREVIRGVPLYYSSWLKVPNERKAALITHIGEDMRRLEAMSIYIDDEINRLAREGSSEGTLPVWVGLSRVVPAGVAGEGKRRRVPTIRTTRMRMAMAILSCVIYGFEVR
nr:hypothetical protein [Tanacetum cinerariifolium]